MAEQYKGLYKILDSGELKNRISASLIEYWNYLGVKKGFCNSDEAIKLFLENEKTKVDFIDIVENETFSVRGKKVLDIGCGKGGVVVACANKGADVFGIDPDKNEVEIAKLRNQFYGLNSVILEGSAENIPFPDNYFDLTLATSVLEHVKNLDKVIEEMVRVTKKDGFCCTTTPNPFFPREGHYKIFWLPFMPSCIGVWYLKLRKLNPDFFKKGMIYPYPSIYKIKNLFGNNGTKPINVTEINMFKKIAGDPCLIKNKFIRHVISILKKIKLDNIAAKLVTFLYLYPSVLIISKKIIR